MRAPRFRREVVLLDCRNSDPPQHTCRDCTVRVCKSSKHTGSGALNLRVRSAAFQALLGSQASARQSPTAWHSGRTTGQGKTRQVDLSVGQTARRLRSGRVRKPCRHRQPQCPFRARSSGERPAQLRFQEERSQPLHRFATTGDDRACRDKRKSPRQDRRRAASDCRVLKQGSFTRRRTPTELTHTHRLPPLCLNRHSRDAASDRGQF